MTRAVYVEPSALVKLVGAERESGALQSFVQARHERLVSSVLADVEVGRAARRLDQLERGHELMSKLLLIELTAEIRARASDLEPPSLRSLDAIHVATAASLGDDLECLVAYDERLLGAARALGLPVASPA